MILIFFKGTLVSPESIRSRFLNPVHIEIKPALNLNSVFNAPLNSVSNVDSKPFINSNRPLNMLCKNALDCLLAPLNPKSRTVKAVVSPRSLELNKPSVKELSSNKGKYSAYSFPIKTLPFENSSTSLFKKYSNDLMILFFLLLIYFDGTSNSSHHSDHY